MKKISIKKVHKLLRKYWTGLDYILWFWEILTDRATRRNLITSGYDILKIAEEGEKCPDPWHENIKYSSPKCPSCGGE